MEKKLSNNIHNLVPSSYSTEDCIFLLEDYTDQISSISLEEKEAYINAGGNYSEVLSKEEPLSEEVHNIFRSLTKKHSAEIAQYVGSICDYLYEKFGKHMVFVSLARAGSPVGVLMKRYMEWRYHQPIPHYSISIIRDKGIDDQALDYIISQYPKAELCFIDGWTGRGSITTELQKAIVNYNSTHQINLNDDLTVLIDPAKLSRIAGTKKDVCLPNACLNSTVSGLVSRTICPKNKQSELFHGAKYLSEFAQQDMSEWFITQVSDHFTSLNPNIAKDTKCGYVESIFKQLEKDFGPLNIKKVKFSIGESSRAVIRRKPRMILVKDKNNSDLDFILYMAKQKNVEVREYDTKDYACITLLQ